MREKVALESVAAPAGRDQVAWGMGSAARQGDNVVNRGVIEVQDLGAVHAAAAAVPHGGRFQGAFVITEAGNGGHL
jgi:hypothetical protein